MTFVLQVKNLDVEFDRETIIKNLSFNLSEGESLAIIGPNGSGKTTLLRALIGAISFTGEVQWKAGMKIGYVPQKIDLEKRLPLTLEDFLMTKIKIKNRPSGDLGKVLKLVNLTNELLKRPLVFLSAGQFQRATIAFALIDNPHVLILDEPTSGVDLPGEERVYDTIHRLQKTEGLSVIIVSHDLSLVYRYADKVLCLNRQMICYGEPQEVLAPEQLQKVYGERVMYQHEH